jgi:hypothetical protein
MAKIELFYGWPTTTEREENIEEWICDCDINLETAVILKFKSLVNSLSRKNEASDNYFELVVTSITGAQVDLPKISMGTHRHKGFVLPKIVIHGFYLVDRESNQKALINNTIIDGIGLEFERDFEFDYHSYKRVGKAQARNNDIIYDLRNKPHIYYSGEFFEVK